MKINVKIATFVLFTLLVLTIINSTNGQEQKLKIGILKKSVCSIKTRKWDKLKV